MKNTTAENVLSDIRLLGSRSETVFSGHRQSIYGKGCDLYLYADGREVLLVGVDYFPSHHLPELADEEEFNGEHPLWFTEVSHRTSPVVELWITKRILRNILTCYAEEHDQKPLKVSAILLTNSDIINSADMAGEWKHLGISVFCKLTEIKKGMVLPVNNDLRLDAADPVGFFLNYRVLSSDIAEAHQQLLALQQQSGSSYHFQHNRYRVQAADMDLRDEEQEEQQLEKGKPREEDTAIKDVSITVCRHHNKYTHLSIEVRITVINDGILDPAKMEIVLATDSYMPVCSKIGGERTDDNSVVMTCWPEVLLPGKYLLIVRYSHGMPMRIDFQIDDKLTIEVENSVVCLPHSEEEALLYLQLYESDWEALSVPGWTELRHYVMRLRQIDLYNDERSYPDTVISPQKNLLLCIRNDHHGLNEERLTALAELVDNDFKLKIVDCSTLYDKFQNNPLERFNNEFSNLGVMTTICLTNIRSLLTSSGNDIVRRIASKVRSTGCAGIPKEYRIWLLGSEADIDEVLAAHTVFSELFWGSQKLRQQAPSLYDQIVTFIRMTNEEHIVFTDNERLVQTLWESFQSGSFASWSCDDMKRFILEKMHPLYIDRLLANNYPPQLSVDDIDFSPFMFADRPDDILNGMVGLDEVKQRMIQISRQVQFEIERRKQGLATSAPHNFHMVFTGNPGTGKTTVARRMGLVFKSLGKLSKGEVVTVDRMSLVGQYIGETEHNVAKLLERARGSVLFVDEAYTLFSGPTDTKDYGKRVIESLLGFLSKPHDDCIVIFAGYEKEMGQLFQSNPGLNDRFAYKLHFPDYSERELADIAERLFQKDEYTLSAAAQNELHKVIRQVYAQRTSTFSNARWVELLVSNVLAEMASRVLADGIKDYQTVQIQDVAKGFEKVNPLNNTINPRRKVGFNL
ncbi:MAG: AAA family ATPase [Prevotella sp.]|nr:AAA family ATPase [Prevotella sp.]